MQAAIRWAAILLLLGPGYLLLMLGGCADHADHPVVPEGGDDAGDLEEPPGSVVVDFPDSVLELVIREELEIEAGELTKQDLLGLEDLSSRDRGITDLRGLRHCENLRWLDLAEAGITDASHIEEIAAIPQLRGLLLQYTGITDLAPLAEADSLTSLWVLSHVAVDFSSVAELDQLWELTLGLPNLNELEPIESLTELRGLTFTGNEEPLDLTPVAGLTNLRFITLLGNEGPADFGPLAGLHRLEQLVANNSSAEDLTPLANLHALESLDLMNGRFHDLTGIVELASLETVSLGGTWLLEHALEHQIPALRARGVRVLHSPGASPEIVGTWSLQSILVDGQSVDLADFLGWSPGTAHRIMTVYASGHCIIETLSETTEVLRREVGQMQFYGGLMVLKIDEVDGEATSPYVDFRGTWQATEGHLYLTEESVGETVEIVWAR